MSAYLVDDEHIHVLIWAASKPVRPDAPLSWYYDNHRDVVSLYDPKCVCRPRGVITTRRTAAQLTHVQDRVNRRRHDHPSVCPP